MPLHPRRGAGLSVVLHFVVGEAWRVRCSSRFRDGVHLILANPPWRQLQERAEKIPGDKKHVEGILSQSHCVAQFNTAQKRPSKRKAANTDNVQNGAEGCWRILSEMKRKELHARTVVLCPLSYMWCRCRGALRAAFRCSALRTTRRPEVCRY
jgi:hypothetical protein